jgi:hypothetical protein
LIDLVVIVNLLSALAVLTIRSFGPFPSWLIISRWLLAGILIALNNGIENNPRRALRNFARSALHLFGIEHSALEEPAKINPVIDNGTRDKADPVEMRDLALFRIIRGFYILAFFPAFFCATQAGYIFDGGETPENQRLYWVLVSFPITILISIASSRMFHRANKFNATILMLFLPLIHFIMLLLLD